MPAYTWINRFLNMPEFWMCLMQYSIKALYKLLSSYQDNIFKTVSNIKDEAFYKKSNAWVQVHNQGRAEEVCILPPSCMPLSVAEYASISQNILQYPWKCLNKLCWACQDSEYAWSPYIFDRLLKMS